MQFVLKTCLFILIFSNALAISPEEQTPEESFPTYFARITRGGSFPGIYLKAPDTFAKNFHTYIRKNYWMGPLENTRKELIAAKYDLWFDVYRNTRPQSFLKLSATINNDLQNFCGKNIDFNSLEWALWPTCVRRAFIEHILFSVGSARELANFYRLDLELVKSNVEIFLLPSDLFEAKVREAGWGGPIYFRGATMPDPKNDKRRWIILNDDFLKKYTGFDYPILQMLELAGIANHELSHVMQDMAGYKNELNIEVRSAEQALLIEGHAEYLAEESFKELGLFYKLFANEQAVEVVNREGDQSSLFPYTIGLPFMTTLFQNLSHDSDTNYKLTLNILNILGKNTPLSDFLITWYK